MKFLTTDFTDSTDQVWNIIREIREIRGEFFGCGSAALRPTGLCGAEALLRSRKGVAEARPLPLMPLPLMPLPSNPMPLRCSLMPLRCLLNTAGRSRSSRL